MNERQKRPTELFIAGGDAAELFELVEEPLDLLTQLVLLRIMMNRLDPVRPRWDDRLNPLHGQESTNALLSYALSITTATTAGNAATPSHTGSNPTASLHCPPVNTNDTPVRSSVQAACSLVVSPPAVAKGDPEPGPLVRRFF